MWMTVAVGAIINIILLWLFDLRLGTHLLLGGLISFFTATMICGDRAAGQPVSRRGRFSAEAFELVYNQLMAK